ncbi:helix-turn-helix domain-containing protein [bacterium]|nr:helix-turn-helix domain-containing protein [bacterium]
MTLEELRRTLDRACAELSATDRAAAVAALAGAQVQLVAAMTAPADVPPSRTAFATADELAAEFHLPVTWFRAQARAGRLPARRCGKYWRFDRGAVRAALEADHRMGSPATAEKSSNGAGPFPSVSTETLGRGTGFQAVIRHG